MHGPVFQRESRVVATGQWLQVSVSVMQLITKIPFYMHEVVVDVKSVTIACSTAWFQLRRESTSSPSSV